MTDPTQHDGEDPGVPGLLGISHIALTADDLDAAERFWTGVLGFETTTRLPDLLFVVHREARIGLGVTRHGGSVTGPFDPTRTGLDHLALAVADAETLERWRERLDAHAVPHSGIVDESGLHLNLTAPSGIAVELYVMDAETAAAFGVAGGDEAVARGHGG